MSKMIILIIILINGIKSLDFESLEFKEISLKEENDMEFDIYPNETYKFISGREDYMYCFQEEFSYILNFSENNELYPFPFEDEEIYLNCLYKKINIFVNYYRNLKNNIKIKISSIPYYEKINSLETINEDKVFYMFNNGTSNFIHYFYSLDNNCIISVNINHSEKDNFMFVGKEFFYEVEKKKNDFFQI